MATKSFDGAVEWYSIERNMWFESESCLSMNEPRWNHACCALGAKIYVVGGSVLLPQKTPRNSIESLNVRKLIKGEAISWELIVVDYTNQ